MQHSLHTKVESVARRARTLVLLHGWCWWLGIVVATAFSLGTADYLIRFRDPGVRWICSLGLLAIAAWSFLRLVRPALRQRFDVVTVAQHIEQTFPQLGDRLSSTIAFVGVPQRYGSAQLRHAVVAETELLAGGLNLFQCLELREIRRAVLVVAPLLLVLGGICALDVDSATRAARRLALPWSQETWPLWNALAFESAPQRIAAGQDFEVTLVDRHGRLPDQVMIQYWFDGDDADRIESRQMRSEIDRLTDRRPNVSRPFRYRAAGGDDDTMAWIPLEVVPPVQIHELQIAIDPPGYSGLGRLESSGGPVLALEDSKIRLAGRTSRPVASVVLRVELDSEVHTRDAELSADRRGFAVETTTSDLIGSGQYWIEVVESDGVTSGHETRARWHVVADEPPTVTIEVPARDATYTPDALIPIRGKAVDDLAIGSIQRRQGELVERLPMETTAEETPVLQLNQPHEVQFDTPWDLAPLGLAPGDVVEVVIVAADRKLQESRAVSRTITIISKDELDYRLRQRQRELLQQVVEALRLQQAGRNQLALLQRTLHELGRLTSEDMSMLQGCELQQAQIERLLGPQADGAEAILLDLQASLAHNRIDEPQETQRLAVLLERVAELNGELLPGIHNELLRAVRTGTRATSDGIASLVIDIGSREDRAIAVLQEMVTALSRWDDYRRFARDVSRLLSDQRQLSRETSELTTIGKRLEELTPQERADVGRVADRQQQLARRFDRLRAEMGTLVEQLGDVDATAAATLREAIDAGTAAAVAEKMRQAGTQLDGNQLGNATHTQQEIERGLQESLDVLTNRGRQPGGEPRAADTLMWLATRLVPIVKQQQAIVDEARRGEERQLAPDVVAVWERTQKELAVEVRQLSQTQPWPRVFAHGLSWSETQMLAAADLLRQNVADARTLSLQEAALDRLRQLLAALQTPPLDPRESPPSPPEGNEEQPAETPTYNLAELRLIHLMQVELYRRTTDVEEHRPSSRDLDAAARQEVDSLAREQAALARLLAEVITDRSRSQDEERTIPQDEGSGELDRVLEQAGLPGDGSTNEPPLADGNLSEQLLDDLRSENNAQRQPTAGEDLGAQGQQNPLAPVADWMAQAGRRLERQDTSLGTLQLQRDAMATLSHLLEQLDKQSASSAAAGATSGGTPGETGTRAGGAGAEQGADVAGVGTENLIEGAWGRLPERVRQEIQSPLHEEFLPEYERIIRQYYKRLAREQQRLRSRGPN